MYDLQRIKNSINFEPISGEEYQQKMEKKKYNETICGHHNCWQKAVGHVFFQPMCTEHFKPYEKIRKENKENLLLEMELFEQLQKNKTNNSI